MTTASNSNTTTTAGLRTRFAPKTRAGQGFVNAAPWLDMVLLAIFFILVESRIVIQPGVMVNLPVTPFTGGSVPTMTAVVISVPKHAGTTSTIVFFDDDRFLIDTPEHRNALASRISTAMLAKKNPTLVLQLDSGIPHGIVMEIVELARMSGVKEINMAVRTQ